MAGRKGHSKIPVTKEELSKLYWEDGLSMRVISAKYGLSPQSTFYWFGKLGVKTRNKSEALKLGLEKGRVNPLRGKDNPRWKGEPIITTGGYRAIYFPDHPRGRISHNFVLEHILVWEKAHGMPIPDGWIVHHLNGIKNDNRPDNLYGMPRRLHHDRLILNEVRKRIRQLENELDRIKGQGVMTI